MIDPSSDSPLRFALLGAAGYIAPRHLQAIRDNGAELLAAMDPSDSVGVLDRYFPQTAFFTEFERLERYLEKLRREGQAIQYLSICSPNYLHDAQVRYGLRYGAQVICEKPLVLNPWNAQALQQTEAETGCRVFTILQLRLLPAVRALYEAIRNSPARDPYQVELHYITPRGPWYHSSWKGRPEQSGGIATNIGIHFFDLLLWLFGPLESSDLLLSNATQAAGQLQLTRARVKWSLSIDAADLPPGHTGAFRQLLVDGQSIDLSAGFEDLHTRSYEEILAGRGFGIEEVMPSIELVSALRTS